MKINEAGPAGKAIATTKKGAKSKIASGFGSILDTASADEVSAPPEVASTSSISMIDSLIAVQQMETDYNGNSKSYEQGKETLDLLDEIKKGVLDGGISAEKLQKLRQNINKERGWVIDDKLSSILDEIETRAQVELAKLDFKA